MQGKKYRQEAIEAQFDHTDPHLTGQPSGPVELQRESLRQRNNSVNDNDLRSTVAHTYIAPEHIERKHSNLTPHQPRRSFYNNTSELARPKTQRQTNKQTHYTSATMGWNPFSTSPTRSSYSSYSRGPSRNYARSSAGSSYSSSHRASTSRYGRQPRDGYLQYLYRKLRQLWRELVHYARRHPYKVFFAVIMPLVSGGVLHKLARQFGVNLPEMGGSAARGGFAGSGHTSYGGGGGGSYYGSQGYGPESSRGGQAGMFGGLDVQSVAGGIGNLATIAQMASKFM